MKKININTLKSAVWVLFVVLILSVFWYVFGTDTYNSENYTYKPDLSTMSMVDNDSEEIDKFIESSSKRPENTCSVDLKAYINKRNGWKTQTLTFTDNGACFSDSTTKTGLVKQTENGVKTDYHSEFTISKDSLNRLYTSGTGAVGVFQFNKEVNALGELDMTGYIFTDNTYKKLAEVYVGKNKAGSLVYKKEIIWGDSNADR